MKPVTWMRIENLPVSEIQAEVRYRGTVAPGVTSIVSSISEIGMILKPLIVRRIKGGYRLIDGLHRLEAASKVGLEEVPVRACVCTDAQAMRMEIDANVAGAPLNPLDMAVFLAAHKALYEKEHPEVRRGSAGGRAKNEVLTDIMSVCSFAANAAEVFDKSERHIRRLISVGETLSKEQVGLLRKAPKRVQFKDLEQIAKCGEEADRSAICVALGAGTAKTAKEVLNRKKAPGAAVSDPVEKALDKLLDAWQRAPKEARRRFAASQAEELSELLEWAADAHPAPEAATGGDVVQLNTAREA